ncbi:MAG: trigger factor [Anaerolineales bacterium]|nr:trigger factor [Anaerolineales bacterium]MCS7247086.1 trigger factor [Anaerolineales bacterium]MDW8160897.1 trigger factor [Anaerolineales bacterium]MDW8446875.1 trigger factor [Anaerolineales bacterium]
MKVEKTPLQNRTLKLVVEASPEETENARRSAVQKLGKRVRVPGFRPGKAPYSMVLKSLDPGLLQEETLAVFLDRYYPEILEQEGIEPYDVGRLKSVLNLDPLKVEIHVPLKPLVQLGDYHSIRIPYEPPVISEEQVERALDLLRQRHAILEPAEREIQKGDVVYIDLIALRKAHDAPGQVIATKDDFPVLVLEDREDLKEFEEYPFEGFSRALLGRQAGERFSVEHSYPHNSRIAEFAGMDIRFEVRVREVKARILPELNDEFAQSLGEYSSLEELRNSVRSMLEREALEEYLKEYDSKALEEVIKISTIEYPPELIEREREAYLAGLERRLRQHNLDLELYKKIRGEQEFEKEVQEAVEYRLKATLTLLEVAKREQIRVDPEKLRQSADQAVRKALEKSQELRIPKQVGRNIALRALENQVTRDLFEVVYKRLRQIAKGEGGTRASILEGEAIPDYIALAEGSGAAESNAPLSGDEGSGELPTRDDLPHSLKNSDKSSQELENL